MKQRTGLVGEKEKEKRIELKKRRDIFKRTCAYGYTFSSAQLLVLSISIELIWLR